MTHPCNQCDFQATSARQLSRHKAVTHVKNPLSCILCDFVTAYQTNLLRHRREVHGILGSKGNKSCKFCGFEADDNDTLIMHQLQSHQDILKSARERFAREKKSARGNCPLNSDNELNNVNDSTSKLDLLNSNRLFNFSNLTKDNSLIASSVFNNSNNFNQQLPESSEHSLNEDDDDKDFWKEGFLDNPASLVNFNQFSQTNSLTNSLTTNFLANFQKNFNNAFKFNSNFNSNQLDLNNLANFSGLNSLSNLNELKDMNNDLNALNSFGNNFNSTSTYQDPCSPESSNSATSENNNYSGPESKSSNLEINLQPECDLNEIVANSNEIENNNQVDEEEDNIVVTPSIAITSSSSANSNNQELAPTKIRRQYACTETNCDFRTVNPREFLYHRRDIHNQKVKIFECPYCVYACRSLQKLQRHMLLVHKLETSITPPTENGSIVKQQQPSSNSTTKKEIITKKSSSKSSTNSKKQQDNDESSLNQPNDLDNDEDDQIYEKSKSSSPSTRSASKGNRKVSNDDKPQQVISTGNSNKQMVQMIKCKYCQFQTDSFSKLEKHENTFHLEKRYQCPFCEIKFENLVWLQRHLLHMHQNNEKANQIVETLELILPSKRKRMKTNHNQNSSTATTDNATSAEFDLNDLEKLDKTCTKCSICNYETKWFSELQKHMRVHINEKPFNCQLCSFKTKWKGDLNRHTQKYHAKAFSELNSNDQCNNNEEQDAINDENNDEQFESNEDNLDSEPLPADILENYRSDNESEEDELMMDNNLVFDTASQMNNDLPIDYSSLNFNKLLNLDSKHQQPPLPEPQQQKTISSSLTLRNLNENLVKVYKCSYCDFICNTASRFHVHFVQHINTKPFMCSVCDHRNWSWDIGKHIKMKSQKDNDHANATAVLVHHSGKRDYRKYDKYLILINKKDIDGNSSNQQDTRGTIDPLNICNLNNSNNLNNQLSILSNSLSNSLNNSLNNLNSLNEMDGNNFNSNLNSLSNLVNRLNENQNDNDVDHQDDDYNAESIVITPDISFSVGNETLDVAASGQLSLNGGNSTNLLSNSLNGFNNNLALNSILNQSNNNSTTTSTTSSVNGKPSKLFYCAYCDYTHRDSKSLVSHLSIHAGKKPFKCRLCGFSSNWREVLNRHVASRHSGTSADIEQLFKYTVSKYICRIIDEKGQINPGPEITTQASIKQLSNGNLSAVSPYHQSNNFNGTSKNNSYASNYQDFQDYQQQNSLMMLNSILAQQLSGASSLDTSATANSSKTNLLNLPNLSNLNGGDQQQLVKQLSKETKPKIVETPEVLAKHGIQGKVSGFKGEFKCDKCPFRAEKAFHMDFHSKRHVKMPGSEFKCQFCHFWVSARKSLVKHEYLHKYKDV